MTEFTGLVGYFSKSLFKDPYFTKTGVRFKTSRGKRDYNFLLSRDEEGLCRANLSAELPLFNFCQKSRSMTAFASVEPATTLRSRPKLNSATFGVGFTPNMVECKDANDQTKALEKTRWMFLSGSWQRDKQSWLGVVWQGTGGAVSGSMFGANQGGILVGAMTTVVRPLKRFSIAMSGYGSHEPGKKPTFLGVDGRMEYSGDLWKFLGYVDRMGDDIGVTIARDFAKGRTRVALDMLISSTPWYAVEDTENSPENTHLALAVHHKVDENSVVKARIDTNDMLRAVYIHKISEWCTQSFSFRFNFWRAYATGKSTAAFALEFSG